MSRPQVLLATLTLLTACGSTPRTSVGPPKPTFARESWGTKHHHHRSSSGPHAPSTQSASPPSWQEPFGPTGPVMVDRTAVDRRWVSFCAPEANGTAPLTLKWQDGQEQSISAVLGQSPDGSAMAYAVGDDWRLVAIDTKREINLTRLGLDRRLVVNEHNARSIVFHPTRTLVALLLRQNDEPSVLLLDYADGSEVAIRPLSREVFHMAWAASGNTLLLDEIPRDTNENQRLDWPLPQATSIRSFCGELAPRFVAASPRGDRVVTTLAPIAGGAAVLANGAWLHDGQVWLGFTEAEGLVAFEPNARRRLTPMDCEVRPVAAHGATKQLLVGCLSKGRLSLGLVTSRAFRALGVEMPYAEDFELRVWPHRFLPIYSGTSSTLVDFEERRTWPLHERDQLLAQAGAHVVLRRGTTVVRRNPSDASEVVVASSIAGGARVVLGQSVAWVDPYVVSADPASVPHVAPRVVAAVSEDGCALCYTTPANTPDYPRGPLYWVCGNPSAVDKALTSADTVENRASGSIAKASSTQASTSGGKSSRNPVKRGRGAVVAAR
jgi:hypothetical protein